MSILQLHEISEAGHRILNPITESQLMTLAAVCRAGNSTRLLDLACGKGELLCQWAARLGVRGTGVDISPVFLRSAADRADELAVAGQVEFIEADASTYTADRGGYDIAACIGATWIGGGPVGTIEKLRPAVQPGGLIVIGEPYWVSPPPDAAFDSLGVGRGEFTDLVGLLDRFEGAGVQLAEMVLADGGSWDRYVAAQWWTLQSWLTDHPEDPRWAEVAQFRAQSRRAHLAFGRRYLGWGVFVLKI